MPEEFDIENQDHFDAAPQEMKDHMWAALLHMAGRGPHPGKYEGPEFKGVPEDAETEADLQRAREGEV